MQYIYNNYPFYHTNHRNTFDVSLINDIQKAINGEYTAIKCYEQLARMAKTQVEKEQILEIRQDEIRHFEAFSEIYRELTGRQPAAENIEKCPDQYQEGLEFAFRDEQETVDFYQDIADKSQNPVIKETFRRAAFDEQNHAVWFLYFLFNKQIMTTASRQPTNYGSKYCPAKKSFPVFLSLSLPSNPCDSKPHPSYLAFFLHSILLHSSSPKPPFSPSFFRSGSYRIFRQC